MSDDEGIRLSRRSLLASTAALGLAGSSTAVARQFGDGVVDAAADDAFEFSVDSAGWPMRNQDGGNTNANWNSDRLSGKLTTAWEFQPTDRGVTEPLIAGDTVYVRERYGSSEAHTPPTQTLYALDAEDGAVRWTTELQWTNGLVVADGRVYVSRYGEGEESTRALDADTGEEIWTADYGNNEPVLADESLVFVDEGPDGRVQGVTSLSRADGSLNWQREFGFVRASNVASGHGSVYVGESPENSGNALYSLSARTGETEWSKDVGDAYIGDLTVTDAELYLNTYDEVLNIDSGSGQTTWTWRKEGSEEMAHTIRTHAAGDGRLHVHFKDSLYTLVAKSGAELSSFEWDRKEYRRVALSGDALYYLEETATDAKDILWVREAGTGGPVAKHRLADYSDSDDTGIPVEGSLYDVVGRKLVVRRQRTQDSGSDDGGESGDDSTGSDETVEPGSGSDDSGESDGDSGSGGSDSKRDC